MMRRVPAKSGGFDEAGPQTGVVGRVLWLPAFGPARRRRPYRVSRGNGPIARWFILPHSGVPLADEAAPVFNVQLSGAVAHPERSGLVAIHGSRQDVNAVEITARQVDCLPLGDKRVRRSGGGRSKLEPHAIIVDFTRQHLGRKRIAFAIESGVGVCVVAAASHEVVSQLNGARLDGG